ncbi:MAG: MoaD/ThiS family protein [Desulfobacterales bacterium]|jgi:sulfur-carrier protein|nr:MoaD/ThiS family protein [Desulfobacterales bacterium]
MDVEIRLFESLKKHQPEGAKVQLAAGSRVTDLLDALGISMDDVGILIVNRSDGRFDQQLQAGDVVTLIPPIGGG